MQEHPITFTWHDGTSQGSCVSCDRSMDLQHLKLIPMPTVSLHIYTSSNSTMTPRLCVKCLRRAKAAIDEALRTAPTDNTPKTRKRKA